MRNIIRAVLIFFGIFLIISTSILALVSNFNFGIIITLSVGFFLALYGIYFNKIQAFSKSGILKHAKYILYLGGIFMVSIIGFISFYGQNDNVTYTEDAVIVLGAGIRGETVTYPLMYRLEKAVEYNQKNPNAFIVVSGGQGPQEDITEALAMERYLIRRGVQSDKIIKEERSTSTFENFVFSKQILDKKFNRPYKTAFITNNFHIYRASRLAKIAELDATHLHAEVQWYTVAVNYLREFTAVLKLWVIRR